MELTQEQKLLQQVINEAWENETFKNELSENPIEAIEKLTGEKLDLGGKELIVRDQTDEQTIFINIPAEQNLEDVELNEEQLEAVAGGMDMMHILNQQFPVLKVFPKPGSRPGPVIDVKAPDQGFR